LLRYYIKASADVGARQCGDVDTINDDLAPTRLHQLK
jgi:hypothetical protein